MRPTSSSVCSLLASIIGALWCCRLSFFCRLNPIVGVHGWVTVPQKTISTTPGRTNKSLFTPTTVLSSSKRRHLSLHKTNAESKVSKVRNRQQCLFAAPDESSTQTSNSGSSNDFNVVFRPSSDDKRAFDSLRIGSPKVHRYIRDNGEESQYIMWYHGRSQEPADEVGPPDVDAPLPPLSTGRIGMAFSKNGLHWERPKEGSASEDKDGVCLGLNQESWWGFDTSHIGLGQVLLPMSTPAIMSEGGVYIMYYMGGTHEEQPIHKYMMGGADEFGDRKVRGMRMKIGIALSQDGKSWGRVEGDDHTGACVVAYDQEEENSGGLVVNDRGLQIQMDEELYVGWPDVMLNTYMDKISGKEKKEFLMFYTTSLKETKERAIGLAVSEDGFRWSKRGHVLKPSTDFDQKGVARCTVVKTANFSDNTDTWVETNDNSLIMWYEGIGSDNKHRILSATSNDGGRSWTKSKEVALEPSSTSGAWDERSVSAPHILRMDDGTLRMYYVGQNVKGDTAIGVAKSLDDGITFEREQAQVVLL